MITLKRLNENIMSQSEYPYHLRHYIEIIKYTINKRNSFRFGFVLVGVHYIENLNMKYEEVFITSSLDELRELGFQREEDGENFVLWDPMKYRNAIREKSKRPSLYWNIAPQQETPIRVGVEIEAQMEMENLHLEGWEQDEDGSLRPEAGYNGVEYKFICPVGINEAKARLAKFSDEAKANGIIPVRAGGIHVHVSGAWPTNLVMQKRMAMGIIKEWKKFDDEINAVGDDRNKYCVEIDKPNIMSRYVSVNFQALKKCGTVEFRSFNSSTKWTDLYRAVEIAIQCFEAGQQAGGVS